MIYLTHETEILQAIGWALTLVGQFQVTAKRKRGFATWTAANLVLITLNVIVGLYWSAGMFLTNLGFCVWSYSVWSQEERAKDRRIFYKGALR